MAGPYSTTINWDTINTLTERHWRPGVVDNIFGSNTTFQKMYKSGDRPSGGTFLTGGVLYGEGPGGAYSGVNPLDLSIADIVTQYQYTWKQYYAGAGIAWLEELKNNGEAALASALGIRMDTMEMTLQNKMGQGMFHDGSDPLQITGLGAHISTTNAIVVGGISANTNTWWRNVIVDMTSVPINTFKLRQGRGLATQLPNKPNAMITTQAIHDLFYATLVPQQRFTGNTASGGFRDGEMAFEDMAFEVDSHCPAGYLYMPNLKYINLNTHSMDDMKLWGWMSPHDQMFKTNKMTWTGNMIGFNRRFQVVFYNITQ